MTPIFGDTPTSIVCGHRGAPTMEPENTLASFSAAASSGATWVEFDVRPTADARLAIHHDPATSSGVHLATTNYANLDASIPLFGDLVAAQPTLGLDIEMKTDDIAMSLASFAELVVHEIDLHCTGATELMVTSFDADALQLVHELRPEMATGLLFWKEPVDRALARAIDDGHTAVAPSIKLLRPELVEQARAASLAIATWTVNDPEEVARASTLGVDMIIGDDPAVIVENL